MFLRRTLAILTLIGGMSLFIPESRSLLSAADTEAEMKAERKAARLKKLLELRKSEEVKKPEEIKKPAESKVVEQPKPVVPAKAQDVQGLTKLIDLHINKNLTAAKLTPSEKTSDAEFLRRVALDITGVTPSLEQTKAFLESTDPLKRAKWIDELLASSNYSQHQADIWTGLMYPIDSDNRFVNKEPLTKWLKESFHANKPWNTMVNEIVVATGDQDTHGEVTYYMANRGVDKMTDSIGKLFLGIQLQCAQCHNHPFTSWKQNEYWGMAQFFYKVSATVNRPNKGKEVESAVVEKNSPNRKMNPVPESAKTVNPKFLGGSEVKLNSSEPYRPVLAKWLTSADNSYFGKAMVNRTWAMFLGKGFVNPVDDMLDENEPSHPELLKALTGEFIASGFDLKHLIRGICNSEVYQRSSKPTEANKDDKVLFSHQAVKTLSPEQLYDSITSVIGSQQESGKGGGKGAFAPKGGPVTPRDRFVSFFLPGENAKATEYDAGIPQVLRLMNAQRLNSSATLMKELARLKPEEAIEKLYMKVLSRRPTSAEVTRMKEYATKQSDNATAYADILWVLLNGSEFALNR